MKYLKLFEDFTEQFDYNIEQIKEVLKLRETEFNDVEFLDSGMYGSAFDLNNGFVLKLTSMDSELYYAKKLINIDSDFLVKVKDVFYHKYHDVGYKVKVGFIIMEKLDIRNGNRFERFVDRLNVYDSPKSMYKTISDEKVLEYFKSKMIETNEEEILHYWNLYKNIVSECEKYNLPTDDLRGRNIGFRDNTPVFFDIGDVYKSNNHDYRDIDILEYNINI